MHNLLLSRKHPRKCVGAAPAYAHYHHMGLTIMSRSDFRMALKELFPNCETDKELIEAWYSRPISREAFEGSLIRVTIRQRQPRHDPFLKSFRWGSFTAEPTLVCPLNRLGQEIEQAYQRPLRIGCLGFVGLAGSTIDQAYSPYNWSWTTRVDITHLPINNMCPRAGLEHDVVLIWPARLGKFATLAKQDEIRSVFYLMCSDTTFRETFALLQKCSHSVLVYEKAKAGSAPTFRVHQLTQRHNS